MSDALEDIRARYADPRQYADPESTNPILKARARLMARGTIRDPWAPVDIEFHLQPEEEAQAERSSIAKEREAVKSAEQKDEANRKRAAWWTPKRRAELAERRRNRLTPERRAEIDAEKEVKEQRSRERRAADRRKVEHAIRRSGSNVNSFAEVTTEELERMARGAGIDIPILLKGRRLSADSTSSLKTR